MALKEVGVKLVVEGLSGFKSSMGDAKSSISGLGDQLKQASPALRGVGLAMTGAAAGIGIASLKMAGDFDSAMRNVNTMLGLGKDEFDDLSKKVLQAAQDVGTAPEEMANALYQVVSAGVPAANALDLLTSSAKAAVGGNTDVTTAVDGVTTVLNAFGLEATQADSVLSAMLKTVDLGKTNMEELSSYMFQVASTAAAMEVPFNDVSAALATMTVQGVPTAQATTQLRQAMVALQKPTDSMKQALNKLGYESGREIIKAKGLQGALDLLRDSAEGNDETLGLMFGSVEGLNAVLTLTGDNTELYSDNLDKVTTAAKEATKVQDNYNEVSEGGAFQFKQFQTQMESLSITLGTALMPALITLVEAIAPILTSISEWIAQNPELSAAILLIVGGLGSLALILGTVVPAVSAVITVIGFGAGAFGAILAALLSPIGLVVAAVAALAVAAYLIYDNWDAIAGFFSNLWDSVYNIFKKYWEYILAVIFPAVGLPILIAQNWGKITEVVSDIWDAVVGFFRDNWKLILGIIFPAYGLYQLVSDNWGKITDAASEIWDAVYDTFSGAWDDIVGGIAGFGTDLWNAMKSAFSFLTDAGGWLISTVFGGIDTAWDGLWNGIKTGLSAIGDGIKNAFQVAFQWLFWEYGWFKQALNSLSIFWGSIWDGMKWAVKLPINGMIGFINGMIGGLESAINAVASALNAIPDFSIPSWVPGIGGNSFGIPNVRSVSLGRIPKLYTGGEIAEGGLAMVGERGPELVSLPAGATVRPITNNYNITENYARPESPQSLDLSLQALAMYART